MAKVGQNELRQLKLKRRLSFRFQVPHGGWDHNVFRNRFPTGELPLAHLTHLCAYCLSGHLKRFSGTHVLSVAVGAVHLPPLALM